MKKIALVPPKEIEHLKVYRGSSFAGLLKRTPQGSAFEFHKDFFKSQYSGLSFHIKNTETLYKFSGDSLPPFFAGLLPEGLRLKSLIKKIKTSEDDLFSIFAAIGSQCIGDVYALQEQKDSSKKERPIDFDQIDFYDLFYKNLGDNNLNDESIAGVQEKISASMISFPLKISKKDKFYILKLNPKDRPKLIENEFSCLKLAKKCGLQVNNARIVEDINKQKGLLVERFDRYINEDGSLIMLHQEDACQFLNRYPADKYRLSFKDILKGISEYATAPKIEILKTLEIYAFSYLLGNGDLHAKNISLQTLPLSNKITLTPAYDLISTYIHKDHKMALKINGRDDNIKRKDFLELGEVFSVPEKSTHLMLDKIIKKLTENYRIIFDFMDEKQKNTWIKMFTKRLGDLK